MDPSGYPSTSKLYSMQLFLGMNDSSYVLANFYYVHH